MAVETRKYIVEKEEEEIVSWQCDCCERKSKDGPNVDYHRLPIAGSFSSSFPGDGETLDVVVCGSCVKDWVSSFKLKPKVNIAGWAKFLYEDE